MRLFRRAWRVQVGPFETTALDCAFKITRSVAARPGTCEITLRGLSREQREQILALPRRRPFGSAVQVVNAGTILEVSAGYVDAERPIVFRGNLRRAFARRSHPDTWLELSGGDGEYAIRSARVRRAFAPDTSVRDVLRGIAEAMGVGVGNTDEVSVGASLGDVGALYAGGHVVHGSAADALTSVCRSAGLEWSIQNGLLQILPRGRATTRTAVLLTPDTGLVGSPTKTGRHTAKASCLMIPGLAPGGLVEIRSVVLSGTYRISRLELAGDTDGQEWGASMDLVSLAYYESRRLFR